MGERSEKDWQCEMICSNFHQKNAENEEMH